MKPEDRLEGGGMLFVLGRSSRGAAGKFSPAMTRPNSVPELSALDDEKVRRANVGTQILAYATEAMPEC